MDQVRAGLSIYQVFVRNYSEEGTLYQVQKDLRRIKNMGFDVVYLLPIHPVGVKGRKGTLGSPYSVKDYHAVDLAYGGMPAFEEFLDVAHGLGLKVMMDIVLRHTSRDHSYLQYHKDFYHYDENGSIVNAVPDWTDIADLDWSNRKLYNDMMDTMARWVRMGVDGFRCDVASSVPMEFWKGLHDLALHINSDFVMLAESVEPQFLKFMRRRGDIALCDAELATVFDYVYPYDVKPEFEDAVLERNLLPYQILLDQSLIELPEHARRLFSLENHDTPRFASRVTDAVARKNWIAFSFLIMGCAFCYNGQEATELHQPSLFEKDTIQWKYKDPRIEAFYKQLNGLRHRIVGKLTDASVFRNEEAMEFMESGPEETYWGCFDVLHNKKKIHVHIKDGIYDNLLDGRNVVVKDGEVDAASCPIFVPYKEECTL